MNIQMLLADAQDYYPDFSNSEKGESINADDPRNKEKMYQILGWD